MIQPGPLEVKREQPGNISPSHPRTDGSYGPHWTPVQGAAHDRTGQVSQLVWGQVLQLVSGQVAIPAHVLVVAPPAIASNVSSSKFRKVTFLIPNFLFFFTLVLLGVLDERACNLSHARLPI